jgi:hypothetical protein
LGAPRAGGDGRRVAGELHADLPAPLPVLPTGDGEPTGLDEDRLWEQYKNALDEYRFQVNLNWSRSQYYFVLNVAILVAGVGLLGTTVVPLGVSMVVFGVGAASGWISIMASDVQKGYYANARDKKKALEKKLDLGEWSLATTVGQGGARARLARVTTFQKTILMALIAADLTGLGVSVARALRSDVDHVRLAVRVAVRSAHPRAVPVVFSRNGEVVAAIVSAPGATTLVNLRPGDYDISALAPAPCNSTATITRVPLQNVLLRCGMAPAPRGTHRRHGSRPKRRTAKRHRSRAGPRGP